jgi:hypothetical protein
MADMPHTRENIETTNESENWKIGLFSKGKMLFFALSAVAFVLAFEMVKASHHARLMHIGETVDRELTAFWFLDALAAGLVTFALVWVALSFERMDGLLHAQGVRSDALVRQLLAAKTELVQAQDNLSTLKTQMQDSVRGLAAGVSFLETVNSPELRRVLDSDSTLQAGFISSLANLTGAWAQLIKIEFDNDHTRINGTRYGLICWRVAIETYLAEEAMDIAKRTVATNLGVYVKLIENIVNTVLSLVEGSATSVDLFASTNLLPAEFFNWKEYQSAESEHRSRLGTSLLFIDRYRQTIKKWLALKPGPTLTRVVVVQDLSGDAQQKHGPVLDALGIQSFERLDEQARDKILCDANTGEPQRFPVPKLKDFKEVDSTLLEQHSGAEAYAIDRRFRADKADKLAAANLSKLRLIDVFAQQLHSSPTDKHALYFRINNEECVKHLDHLPTIPVEGASLKSADFIAIRLKFGDTSKVVACIAAQLKPNLETMALHLITTRAELEDVEKFIDYATTRSDPFSKLGQEA